MRTNGVVLAVAGATFAIALNGGTYGLASRSALAIVVWWSLALAVGLGLVPRAGIPTGAVVTGALLAGFGAFTLGSTAWGESAERAFAEFDRVALYLGIFAIAALAGTAQNARRWSAGLAVGITSIALLALASRLFGDLLGSQTAQGFFPSLTRLSYPVEYWNGLAILTGLAVPLLLLFATTATSALWRAVAVLPFPALAAVVYLTSSRGGAATGALGALVFLLISHRRMHTAAAIAFAALGSALAIAVLDARHQLVDGPLGSSAAAAQGRSAAALILLACLLSAAGYAIASSLALRSGVEVPLWAKRGLAALAVMAALVAGLAADPVERFQTFKRPSYEVSVPERDFTSSHLVSSTGSGRWQLWDGAVNQWKARPLIGRGAGSYEAWWARHATYPKFVRDAHSLYLETLGELGLVGFALLVGALGTALVIAARRLLTATSERDRSTVAALIGVLIAFAFGAAIDWIWELTAVAVIGVATLGLLVGAAGRHERAGAGATERTERALRLAPRVAVGLVAAALIALQLVPLLSENEIRVSQEAAARGDGRRALEAAQAARRLEPWASSPYLQVALVREQTGDLTGARRAIAAAIDRDRFNWRLWLVSARLETRAGRIPAARASLRRAHALNPKSPLWQRS